MENLFMETDAIHAIIVGCTIHQVNCSHHTGTLQLLLYVPSGHGGEYQNTQYDGPNSSW